ncbi:MAG: hypothetical protein ABSD68_00910 [Candidatus Micrarchaeales archaeon]
MSKLAVVEGVNFAGLKCTTDIPDNVKTKLGYAVISAKGLKNIWRVDGFGITDHHFIPVEEDARAYIASDGDALFFIQERKKTYPKEEWVVTHSLELDRQGRWSEIVLAGRGWGVITPQTLSSLEEYMGKFLKQGGVAEKVDPIILDFRE